MLMHLGLILLFSNCVRTTEDSSNGLLGNLSGYDKFSLWPSVHNGAAMMKLRKRDVKTAEAGVQGISEGGSGLPVNKQFIDLPTHLPDPIEVASNKTQPVAHEGEVPKGNSMSLATAAPLMPSVQTSVAPTVSHSTNKTSNSSAHVAASAGPLDVNNPGAVKRGLIVFSGFATLAVAYLIFYRAKTKKDAGTQNTNDANQFKYGVLQSEDRKDNLELSRMPLTMESDEEEDEDLEIFDLEQNRKSMSYVTLQTNDQDVVFSNDGRNVEDNNVLLDIDENDTDQLINWSSHGNKSIL